MAAPNLKDYVTVEEAAEILHMGMSTLRKKIAEGHLATFKPGRQVLIKTSDLHAFVKRFSQGKEIKR